MADETKRVMTIDLAVGAFDKCAAMIVKRAEAGAGDGSPLDLVEFIAFTAADCAALAAWLRELAEYRAVKEKIDAYTRMMTNMEALNASPGEGAGDS